MTPVEWKKRDYWILAAVFGFLFVVLATLTILCPSWPSVFVRDMLHYLRERIFTW